MPLLTTKFFLAVLPMIALGYILGAFIGGASLGWHVHPGVVLLIAYGIVMAIENFRAKYR